MKNISTYITKAAKSIVGVTYLKQINNNIFEDVFNLNIDDNLLFRDKEWGVDGELTSTRGRGYCDEIKGKIWAGRRGELFRGC